MAINLKKGEKLNLTKDIPSLKNIHVGLGWSETKVNGKAVDLDASVFLLGADGKAKIPEDFIYYKQLQDSYGSVMHTGDNRTGDADGDDEVINVFLDKVSEKVKRIVFVVTIYDAEDRRHNFGQVHDSYIKLVNKDNNEVIAEYNLTENFSIEDSLIIAEIYRSTQNDNEWKFKAIGEADKVV